MLADDPRLDQDHSGHDEIAWMNCIDNGCSEHFAKKVENDFFPIRYNNWDIETPYTEYEIGNWDILDDDDEDKEYHLFVPDYEFWPPVCRDERLITHCEKPRCKYHWLRKTTEWHLGRGKPGKVVRQLTHVIPNAPAAITTHRPYGPHLPTTAQAALSYMGHLENRLTTEDFAKATFNDHYRVTHKYIGEHYGERLDIANGNFNSWKFLNEQRRL